MNRERMLKVADEIEAHADHFDMGLWMTSEWMQSLNRSLPVIEAVQHFDIDECGTAACVAGWAAYLYAGEIVEGDTFATAGQRILDLERQQAEQLFETDGDADYVADRMRAWVMYDEEDEFEPDACGLYDNE